MVTDIRVAQLLCSRLCHDLVAPVGAVCAGAELLEEQSGESGEVAELIARAGQRLSRLLNVFRMAFGLRGGADAEVTLAEARDLAVALFESSDRLLDWPPDAEPGADLELPRPAAAVRLLLCLVVTAAGMVPRRGTVSVRVAADSVALRAQVGAVGIRGTADTALIDAVRGHAEPASLTARTVHGHLAACLAGSLGTSVQVTSASGEVVFATVIPLSLTAGVHCPGEQPEAQPT
jgi:histidine phosphotransferase ChpT